MATVLNCLNVQLIFVIGTFSLISKLFIDGMCVMAFAPTTKTISGATIHPLVVMVWTSA